MGDRMRIALLADIHGNAIALDAVLADVAILGGADAFWILGDLAALGPDPVGALERVAALPNARFVRGNTDRFLATGLQFDVTLEEVAADPSALRRTLDVTRSFAWTQGMVTAAGWLNWLAELPLEQRLTLPDGTRLLAVHAAPGEDDGHGVHPKLANAELRELVAGCEADLVCVGHTHTPLDVTVDGVRVVNPGSVSNPFPPDLRASYVVFEADTTGTQLRFRSVEYDREAVIAQLEAVRHPSADYLVRFMRGRNQPGWQKG
jgi:predicted phosphodiesterase